MPENKLNERFTSDSLVEVLPSKELKVLFSWKSPSRPFKKRNKEFWTTVLALIFLVSIILIFAKQWLLVVAIASLAFLYYVLSTVEPEEIEHKITTRGLFYAGQHYPWEAMSQFWFSERYGQRMVNFQLKEGLSGRVTIVLGQVNEKELRELLLKYLLEEEIPPNFLDKASDWLGEKVPLESENERKGQILSSSHKTTEK